MIVYCSSEKSVRIYIVSFFAFDTAAWKTAGVWPVEVSPGIVRAFIEIYVGLVSVHMCRYAECEQQVPDAGVSFRILPYAFAYPILAMTAKLCV